MGKSFSGCFNILEIMINGIILSIDFYVVVRMEFFKVVYWCEDWGKVEFEGFVVFWVGDEINGFLVL